MSYKKEKTTNKVNIAYISVDGKNLSNVILGIDSSFEIK